jgi:nucleoside-diphosphate-sugar epimerase
MKNIFITGSTGFVGKYLITYFNDLAIFKNYLRGSEININEDIVIHLAGKAHDIKKITYNSDYYSTNFELTKDVYDAFLNSESKVFIFLSSVKAVTDTVKGELTEEYSPKPITDYGKSKLLAEQYILNKPILESKRVYILRPCMIHGPGNKGNLNLILKIVCKGLPWPLGAFDNQRSFCSIDNLCFIINELIQNENIPSGIYNIADDEPLSTNELIKLIAKSINKKAFILNFPKFLVKGMSKLGDIFKLPLNTERLSKLTETYVVSNQKIKIAINKPLPVTSRYGLIKTFESFLNNNTH